MQSREEEKQGSSKIMTSVYKTEYFEEEIFAVINVANTPSVKRQQDKESIHWKYFVDISEEFSDEMRGHVGYGRPN